MMTGSENSAWNW